MLWGLNMWIFEIKYYHLDMLEIVLAHIWLDNELHYVYSSQQDNWDQYPLQV